MDRRDLERRTLAFAVDTRRHRPKSTAQTSRKRQMTDRRDLRCVADIMTNRRDLRRDANYSTNRRRLRFPRFPAASPNPITIASSVQISRKPPAVGVSAFRNPLSAFLPPLPPLQS